MADKLPQDFNYSNLRHIFGGDDTSYDVKAGLGGDTGRGEFPNIPGTVSTNVDYKSLVEPNQFQAAAQPQQSPTAPQMLPEEVNSYSKQVLGLPGQGLPINKLMMLADRYNTNPQNPDIIGDRGKAVAANLIKQQMQRAAGSPTEDWIREPVLQDFLTTVGFHPDQYRGWDKVLKDNYNL